MMFSFCSSDTADFMDDLLKKWSNCEVFFKFCELDTKQTVVLIRLRKTNFDVNENILSLEFGRYMQIIPLNASRIIFVSFLKPSSM